VADANLLLRFGRGVGAGSRSGDFDEKGHWTERTLALLGLTGFNGLREPTKIAFQWAKPLPARKDCALASGPKKWMYIRPVLASSIVNPVHTKTVNLNG